jgi:hypothetical protein
MTPQPITPTPTFFILPLDRTLPPWLKDLSEIALDKQADDTAWARGAAAAALKELYGAPWSTTGSARTRKSL